MFIHVRKCVFNDSTRLARNKLFFDVFRSLSYQAAVVVCNYLVLHDFRTLSTLISVNLDGLNEYSTWKDDKRGERCEGSIGTEERRGKPERNERITWTPATSCRKLYARSLELSALSKLRSISPRQNFRHDPIVRELRALHLNRYVRRFSMLFVMFVLKRGVFVLNQLLSSFSYIIRHRQQATTTTMAEWILWHIFHHMMCSCLCVWFIALFELIPRLTR